ncbi:MAG: transglutaminase domain-containing protein [Thermoplasmata archaeon]
MKTIKRGKMRKLAAITAITSCVMLLLLGFLQASPQISGMGTQSNEFEDNQTAVPEGTISAELNAIKVGSKGVWVWGTDVANVGATTLASEFAKHGISDVFVLIKGVSGAYRFDLLEAMYEKAHGKGIRVHAWVICFDDESWGGWINPSSDTYRAYLKNNIFIPLAKNHRFDCVVLDCIRYLGTAYGNTYPITSFCKEVSAIIKAYRPNAIMGAAVMPEMASNAYYYGQDYAQMAQHLDVLIPMAYTHNYHQSPSWVGTVTQYVRQKAQQTNPNCKVWTAIQALDDNGQYMSNTELHACINYALSGGAAGINFFRYPITSAQYQVIDRYSVDNSPPNPSSLTKQETFEACIQLANYIDKHLRTPKYVSTSKGNIPMPQMLYISSKFVYDLSTGSPNSSYTIISCNYAANPHGEAYSGSLTRPDYVDISYRVYRFIENNGVAPNCANSAVGKIRMWEILYINARVVRWYYYNGMLPTLAYVKPVPGFKTDAYSQYTGATVNCQATNGAILNLAMSIICSYSNQANNGTMNPNEAMYKSGEAIYSWVRDNKGYAFYYNTRYGAYRAIFEASSINCCDHANAENALARAVGIPALYRHAYCQFSSGAYGHVWGYFYINGKGWINADPVKKSGGYFGYRYPIISDYGTYYQLQFVIEN